MATSPSNSDVDASQSTSAVDRPASPLREGAMEDSLRDELIRQAAHRRYLERGGAPGSDMEDWLAAEAEIDQTRTVG